MGCKLGLVLFGVGTVGSELADEILSNEFFGIKKITLLALCNSKKTVDNPSGEWRRELEQSMEPLVDKISKYKQRCDHLVFIDCTLSEKVAKEYAALLQDGISVVTANKKGPSGQVSIFGKLPLISTRLPYFGFESTVGAGLPIIKTIQSIISSGDQVHCVEGILSGTLAYLFNEFMPADGSEGVDFLSALETAKKLGYTEPDPLEDLHGMDVARKAVILARLIGSQVTDPADVAFSLVGTDSLGEMNQRLKDLKNECKNRSMILRYVAKISKDQGTRIGLTELSLGSPLLKVTDCDNIVTVYTRRFINGIIIQGSGAGARPTIHGILADVADVYKFL